MTPQDGGRRQRQDAHTAGDYRERRDAAEVDAIATSRSLAGTVGAEPPRPATGVARLRWRSGAAQAGQFLSVSNQNAAPRDSARRLRSQKLGDPVDPVDPSFSDHLGRENSCCVGLSLRATRRTTMALAARLCGLKHYHSLNAVAHMLTVS